MNCKKNEKLKKKILVKNDSVGQEIATLGKFEKVMGGLMKKTKKLTRELGLKPFRGVGA